MYTCVGRGRRRAETHGEEKENGKLKTEAKEKIKNNTDQKKKKEKAKECKRLNGKLERVKVVDFLIGKRGKLKTRD